MATNAPSRAQFTRQTLLRAAGQELAASGGLEVTAVARRAGVSAGLPYRYFGTRSGLLIAVAEDFYDRLGAAGPLRAYPARAWSERERQRIRDWLDFLYADPLAPVMLGSLVGDGEVAAAHDRLVRRLIQLGAANITNAQQHGEIPAARDPEMLAAATLGGIHALAATALAREPRPPVQNVFDQAWAFIRGAVGLTHRSEN